MVDYGRASDIDDEKKAIRASIPEDLYNMPVEKTRPFRTRHELLRRSGINTVGELVSLGEKELLSLRNFGQKSRQEVEEKLTGLGLSFPKISETASEEVEEEVVVEEEPKKPARKKKTAE